MSITFSYGRFSELRPGPGSRVNLNPATTQGADVPVPGAPAKGPNHDEFFSAAVRVTVAHLQVPDLIDPRGGCCPNVAH
jgi:hypothetical protein